MSKTARRKRLDARGVPRQAREVATPVQRWVWLECFCCVAELRFRDKDSAKAALAAARETGEEFPTVVDDRGKVVSEVAICCEVMDKRPRDSEIESYC